MSSKGRRLMLIGIIAVVVIAAAVLTIRITARGAGSPAEILAFDMRTGRIEWSAHPNAVFVGAGSLDRSGLSVYLQRFGGGCEQVAFTITFDPATGRQVSEREEAPYGQSTPSGGREATGDGITVETGRGTVHAHDSTGKEIWAVSLPGDRDYSMLAIGGGRAYAGADGSSPKLACLGD